MGRAHLDPDDGRRDQATDANVVDAGQPLEAPDRCAPGEQVPSRRAQKALERAADEDERDQPVRGRGSEVGVDKG